MNISLITICKNSAKTIQRTVDSVLAQTHLPSQYLFVVAESSDATVPMLEQMLPKLKTAGIQGEILTQNPVLPGQAGIPTAWNQGLERATGDIIALLNSDDWYEPHALAEVAEAFQNNPEVEGVTAPIFLKNATLPDVVLPVRSLRLLPLLMPRPHPGCFFRRSLYQRLGGYNTKYKISADYEFIWRCYQRKVKWQELSCPIVNMETGGLANSSRALARNETFSIARHYAPFSPLPYLAWLLRAITGR